MTNIDVTLSYIKTFKINVVCIDTAPYTIRLYPNLIQVYIVLFDANIVIWITIA